MNRRGSTEFLSSAAIDYYKRFGKQRGIDKFFRNVEPNAFLNRASSESSLQSIRDEDNATDRLLASKSYDSSLDRAGDYQRHEGAEPGNVAQEDVVEVTSETQDEGVTPQESASLEPVSLEKDEFSQKDNEVQEIIVVSNVDEKQTINLNIKSNVEIKLPDHYLNQQQVNVTQTKGTTADLVQKGYGSDTDDEVMERRSHPRAQIPQPPSQPHPEIPPPSIQAFYPTYIFPQATPSMPIPQQKVVYSIDTQTNPQSPVKTMCTSETQTTTKRDLKVNPNSSSKIIDSDISEEPITPTVTTRNDMIVQIPETQGNVSPTSSVALESKLEWDSWGDIGYNSANNTYQACAAADLNETEKQAVNRYFLSRGIEFSPNVIVVRNTPKSKKTTATDKPVVLDRNLEAVKKRALDRKEKWKQIFYKYKDKYQETSSQTTLHFSNPPEAQSTPKLEEVATQHTSTEMNGVDCSVQTSRIDLQCKSIQVETDIDESKMSGMKSDNDSSFVFVKLSDKESYKSKSKRRSVVSDTRDTREDSTKSSSRRTHSHNLDGTFENELKMAIALMNSVLESKSLHVALKKSLVIKIMQKIMNLKMQDDMRRKSFSKESIQGSLSDVSTLRSSRSAMSNKRNEKMHQELEIEHSLNDIDTDKHEKYPRTSSSAQSMICHGDDESKNLDLELQDNAILATYKSEKDSSNKDTHNKLRNVNERQGRNDTATNSGKTKKKSESTRSRPLSESDRSEVPVSIDKSEKVTQLLWIEKEIQHLKHLKQMILHSDKEKSVVENEGEPIKVKIYENVSDYDTRHREGNLSCPDLQQVKARSKLRTPLSPESEDSFMKMIEKRKEKLLQPSDAHQRKQFPAPLLYTKPYTSLTKANNTPSTISSTSSSAFISSGSISVPIGGNTNTTTQYDLKSNDGDDALSYADRKRRSIQTQTSDSVKHTNPIFENRSEQLVMKTKIVDRTRQNKHQQTKPKAMAYVLTFTGQNQSGAPMQNGSKKVSKRAKDPPENTADEFDVRTLEEHLSEKHPQIWRRMDQRNQCIKELRKMRQKRNEQREKLMLLASDTSLHERIKNLPPLPLSQKRLFSTKTFKLHTKKKCQNLSEVQRKKENDMLNNLKRKNRILTDMFNKNLQRQVLRGQMNLSNSYNLMSHGY